MNKKTKKYSDQSYWNKLEYKGFDSWFLSKNTYNFDLKLK